jgi:hypothetical protein
MPRLLRISARRGEAEAKINFGFWISDFGFEPTLAI